MRLLLIILGMFAGTSAFSANLNVKERSKILFTPSFVQFSMQPALPTAGQALSIFLNVDTEFTSSQEVNVILEANLDDVVTPLLNPTAGLFILSLDTIAAGNHVLLVNYFVEDKIQAEAVRGDLLQVEQDISTLEGDILVEDDPAQLLILQAQLAQKQSEQASLNSTLYDLKTLVTSESYNFLVQ